MGYKFNPFTGTLDTVDSPNGVFEELDVNGDIVLDDGGTYTTTLQIVTPTANRTISFPDATGTVGLVAGSSGQLVYNNAGAYAGLSTLTADGSGNVTLTGRWTNSTNGAQSLSPVQVTGAWYGTTGNNTPTATGSTAYPALYISPAGTSFGTDWSTGGTGFGVNAPASFGGNLLDLRVNGTRAAAINPSGDLWLNTNPATGGGTIIQGAGQLTLQPAVASPGFSRANTRFVIRGDEVRVTYGAFLGFAADDSSATASIYREANDTLAQRRGTNAQTLRVYDTFTSATDFHRVAIATARATLSNVSGASVTATALIPAGAVVMGVTSKVTTALGTTNSTTGYKIGTAGDDDRWGDITGTATGTTSDNRNWTAGTIECFPAATDVIVTATGGNFDATGVIYLSVQYMAGEAD